MATKKTKKIRNNKSWNTNYKEYREILENEGYLFISSTTKVWFKYQKERLDRLSPKQIKLLNELNPLLGHDWKDERPKKVRNDNSRKRSPIVGLGKRIEESRLAIGINDRKEFSKKTNIAISTINDWEAEISIPSADRVIILCELFGVTSDWFLFGGDKKKRKIKDKELFDLFEKTNKLKPKEIKAFKKIAKDYLDKK